MLFRLSHRLWQRLAFRYLLVTKDPDLRVVHSEISKLLRLRRDHGVVDCLAIRATRLSVRGTARSSMKLQNKRKSVFSGKTVSGCSLERVQLRIPNHQTHRAL
jgi:hypothetical protein